MNPEERRQLDRQNGLEPARLERKLVLAAAVGVMIGGFFPWAQPFDLSVWGFDDGDGFVTLSSGMLTFILVWLEWRRLTAGAAVALGGFVVLVTVVNLSREPGPGIVLSALAGVALVATGLSAVWKFDRVRPTAH